MAMSKTSQRKVLAVLAGGLVLGVGAAVTLAAWNDSEFATGTFTAGQFNMQGSTNSTDGVDGAWADHETAGAAAPLTFTADFDALSPDDVVYSTFWVRLDATTTADATVTTSLAGDGTGTNAANISYQIRAIGAAQACDASAAAAGTQVLSGTALTTAGSTAGGAFGLTAGAGAAGPAQKLCVIATAGPETGTGALVPGGTATAVWEFAATSN